MSQLCRQFIEKSVGFIDSQSSGVHPVGFVVKISRGCRDCLHVIVSDKRQDRVYAISAYQYVESVPSSAKAL
jgi:hypothetical protein